MLPIRLVSLRLIALLCLLWALAPLPAAAAVRVADAPLLRRRLDNGLEVLLQRDARQPRVALVIAYGVGERDEPKGYAGIAHLVEHLTFRGSRHVAPFAAMSLLERAGASEVNAGTGKDGTYYFAVLPASELELALWIESDRMAFLLEKIDQRSLALEKNVVIGELLQRRSPARLFELHLERLLYPAEHPYFASLEEERDVSATELTHVQWFFQRTYRPDNATLAIVGDFAPETAERLVARYFGPIQNPPGTPLKESAPPVRIEGAARAIVDLPYDRERMAVIFPGPDPAGPDAAATELMAALAGEGRLSRLWQGSVERGLAKSIEASVEHLELASWLRIEAELVHRADHDAMLSAVDAELRRLAHEPPAAGELEAVKQGAVLGVLSAHEQLLTRALLLAVTSRSRRLPLYDANALLANIAAVTPADIQRAAQTYLRFDRRLVAFSRTEGGAPAVGELSELEGELRR